MSKNKKHNLDSQIADKICDAVRWVLPNHDSFTLSPNDAKEVREGFECGIGIENYNDIKEGDVIECFKMEQVERG